VATPERQADGVVCVGGKFSALARKSGRLLILLCRTQSAIPLQSTDVDRRFLAFERVAHAFLRGRYDFADRFAGRSSRARRLEERFVPNAGYHVSCRVQIAGKMTLPDKTIDIEGTSHIEYDERILRVTEAGVVDKTLASSPACGSNAKSARNFKRPRCGPRSIGWWSCDKTTSKRHSRRWPAEAERRSISSAPMSSRRPSAGLLPKTPFREGTRGKADEDATRELTDLVQITAGERRARFGQVDRSLVQVTFEGTINGIGENGPTKHDPRRLLLLRPHRQVALLRLAEGDGTFA